MGAFNTVKSVARCPFCDNEQEWTIQFRYGDCWQYEYKVGDRLRWGGNDNGTDTGGKVRTDGIAEESCKACSHDDIEAAVYFTDNIIQSIELLKEPLLLQDYFEVVPE